ncbi:MAG: hypothetical protein WD872_16330 [Pirellulaceae bacterium]
MNTPEFLAWSLAYRCPIRGWEDGSDPERTERQLRAARAWSDARREGRLFEGFAVRPPDGFRVADALAIYGGAEQVEACCAPCPANALARRDADARGGCFGLLPLPADERQLHAAVDRAIEQLSLDSELAVTFAVTAPRWYGLWLGQPIPAEGAETLRTLLSNVTVDDAACRQGLDELRLGLAAASAARLPMFAVLYPRGRIEGPWWRLAPHCPRCQASWVSEVARQCAVCGYVGHPAPQKKRHARGNRPYAPLARILGSGQAAELAARYAQRPAQPALPNRRQNQPPPAPPDSPRGGSDS